MSMRNSSFWNMDVRRGAARFTAVLRGSAVRAARAGRAGSEAATRRGAATETGAEFRTGTGSRRAAGASVTFCHVNTNIAISARTSAAAAVTQPGRDAHDLA